MNRATHVIALSLLLSSVSMTALFAQVGDVRQEDRGVRQEDRRADRRSNSGGELRGLDRADQVAGDQGQQGRDNAREAQMARPDRSDRVQRSERPERPQRPERPEKPERPGKH